MRTETTGWFERKRENTCSALMNQLPFLFISPHNNDNNKLVAKNEPQKQMTRSLAQIQSYH